MKLQQVQPYTLLNTLLYRMGKYHTGKWSLFKNAFYNIILYNSRAQTCLLLRWILF